VTSDLAFEKKTADHGQGVSGTRDALAASTKFFVVKILTPKPLGLKILQTVFAEPAPLKAFRGWGEGGYPDNHKFPKTELPKELPKSRLIQLFFRNFPQRIEVYFALRLARRRSGGLTPFSGTSCSILSESLCNGLSFADESCRPAAAAVSPCAV